MLALSMAAGAAAPLVVFQPSAQAQVTFSDVSSNYWASQYIQALAARDIISGFPDGTFRPNDPVTRAQFAAMIRKAFSRSQVRNAIRFADVPTNYWAYTAIEEAYTTGFLTGYPGNVFNPEQNIPRVQVLVSLANGLNYSSAATVESTLQFYNDAAAIPGYARSSIAAATEKQIVVNYPNVRQLNPNQVATRAEVAAFIYQALVSAGQANAIPSPYVVGQQTQPTEGQALTIPSGTTIPIRYDGAERVLISLEEPEPVPVTLVVAQNVTTANGTLLIPAGSQVRGELRNVQENGQVGARFYAQELILSGNRRFTMNATSELVTEREVIRRGASVGDVVTNAALGAGAAAAIAAVTGDRAIATEEVLGGVGIGALLGLFLGRDRVELITIDPDRDLNLTLNSNLTIR